MAQQTKHYMDEPDIGSGEKTPGQEDVERDEKAVNVPLPQVGKPQDGSQSHQVIDEQKYAEQRPTQDSRQAAPPGRILQNGDHIARILAVKQPDETYEAQVYVRLAREPEVAETFIPAGIYGTEAEAWTAAEERANRAFKENEF
jgi:hypothetical protein